MALSAVITIVGNLTYDPELRQTRDSKPVVNLTLAVNPRTFDRQANDWKDGEPMFYKASAFGQLAEHIANSFKKGNRAMIHGTMKSNSWTDKDSGVQKTENIIQIEEMGASVQFTDVTIGDRAPRQEAPQNSGGWGDDTPF